MDNQDSYELDDAWRLAHLLWEVAARTSLLGQKALAGTPLTPAASGMLDVIATVPGTSIAEMARRLPVSAQAISQLIARLERLGFLERRLGERGHGVALFVTEEGERARREANEHKVAFEAELARALGERTYRELVRLLARTRPILIELEAQHRRPH